MPTITLLFNKKTDSDYLAQVASGMTKEAADILSKMPFLEKDKEQDTAYFMQVVRGMTKADAEDLIGAAKKEVERLAKAHIEQLGKYGSSMTTLGISSTKLPTVGETLIKKYKERVTVGYPDTGPKGSNMATNLPTEFASDPEVIDAIQDVLKLALANKTLNLTVPASRGGAQLIWLVAYQERTYDEESGELSSNWIKDESVVVDDSSKAGWRVEDLVTVVLKNNTTEVLELARNYDDIRRGLVKLIDALRANELRKLHESGAEVAKSFTIDHVVLNDKLEKFASQLYAITAESGEQEVEETYGSDKEDVQEYVQEYVQEDVEAETEHAEAASVGDEEEKWFGAASSSSPKQQSGENAFDTFETPSVQKVVSATGTGKRTQDEANFVNPFEAPPVGMIFSTNSRQKSANFDSGEEEEQQAAVANHVVEEVTAQVTNTDNVSIHPPTDTAPYTALGIVSSRGTQWFDVDSVTYPIDGGKSYQLETSASENLDMLSTIPMGVISNISFHDHEDPGLRRELVRGQDGAWFEQRVIAGNTFIYEIPVDATEPRYLTVELASTPGARYDIASITGNNIEFVTDQGNMTREITSLDENEQKWLSIVGAELRKSQSLDI